MCKIESYINPMYPERIYYKATYGNETYHHTDRAIVKQWLVEVILATPYKKQKQCITERAINSFYNK